MKTLVPPKLRTACAPCAPIVDPRIEPAVRVLIPSVLLVFPPALLTILVPHTLESRPAQAAILSAVSLGGLAGAGRGGVLTIRHSPFALLRQALFTSSAFFMRLEFTSFQVRRKPPGHRRVARRAARRQRHAALSKEPPMPNSGRE